MLRRIASFLTAITVGLGLMVPLAGPAQATTTAPALSLTHSWESTRYSSGLVGLTVHAGNGRGQTLQLQTFNGAVWAASGGPEIVDEESEVINLTHQFRAGTPATARFRAVLFSGTSITATSAHLTVTYDPALDVAKVQNGTSDFSTAAPKVSLRFHVAGGKGAIIRLQRSVGSVWTNVWASGVLASDASTPVTASYTFPADGTGVFRAAVVRSSVIAGTSAPVRVYFSRPAVSLRDGSDKSNPVKSIIFSGSKMTGGKITIQRLSGTSWRSLWTAPSALTSDKTAPRYTYTFGGEGTIKFRAVLTRGGAVAAISPATPVTFQRSATRIGAPSSGAMFKKADGKVAAGNQLSEKIVLAGIRTNRTGALQELRRGKWVTLQHLSWKKTTNYLSSIQTVKTPVTSATVAKSYRLVVNSSRTEAAYASPVVTIRHENPAHYTGYRKLSYNYMKAYCPRQIIELKSPGFSYAHSYSRKIEMATGYNTGGPLKYVSVHECMHIRQYTVYNDDYWALAKRMDQIYGPKGIEHNADCMTQLAGGNSYTYGYYTKNCSGYRETAARLMLAGKKP